MKLLKRRIRLGIKKMKKLSMEEKIQQGFGYKTGFCQNKLPEHKSLFLTKVHFSDPLFKTVIFAHFCAIFICEDRVGGRPEADVEYDVKLVK